MNNQFSNDVVYNAIESASDSLFQQSWRRAYTQPHTNHRFPFPDAQ